MLFPASSGIAAHTAAPPHIQRHRGEGGSQKKKKKNVSKMYRNVSKCIEMYRELFGSKSKLGRNVSKCIEMYRNVSGDFWNEPKRIEQFSRIKKTKTAHSKIQLENHGANDDNDDENEPTKTKNEKQK